MKRDTTSQQFFDEKYKENPDPWRFASSNYEQSRYDAIIRALGDCHYLRAFEPGCSIGILTARLATICGHVEAMDISPVAVEQARLNCRDFSNVSITTGSLADSLPSNSFDLIVLSEIGYYFTADEWQRLSNDLLLRLCNPGTLLATHWLGESEDHILGGDEVHEILSAVAGLPLTRAQRTFGYRLDRWDRS